MSFSLKSSLIEEEAARAGIVSDDAGRGGW
jgi:hypothetical protein